MGSDGKKDETAPQHVTSKSTSLTSSDEIDLDKNPIQFKQWDGKFGPEAHDKDYMELILRSGQHSDLVKRLIRQRIELRAKEFPRWPGDSSGGVRLMWIESRFWYDRERFLPDFDNDWRNYRARYLHSLELDPREPVHVPEWERLMINPIRRFYMKSGDWFERVVISKFTKDKYRSAVYRSNTARTLMLYFGLIMVYYWNRYGYRKWDSYLGPHLYKSAPSVHMNDKRFPMENPHKEGADYYDYGFTRRNVYKDLRDFEDNTVVL